MIVEIASNVTDKAISWDPLLRSPSGGGWTIETPGFVIVARTSRLRANQQ